MTAPTRVRPSRPVARRATGGRHRTAADPVFLDRTGRRRRIVAAASAAATVLLTLILLALLAGLTGVGPGAMPGWPAANGQARPVRTEPVPTEPSASAAAKAATTRPSPALAPLSGGPSSARSAVPTGNTPATSAVPTISASLPGNGHGRNPSHTPKPHSTRKP
jgi:hypothetical protein